MNFKGQMIEENCLISLKKEPVFDPTDDCFFDFGLFMLMSDIFIHIFL